MNNFYLCLLVVLLLLSVFCDCATVTIPVSKDTQITRESKACAYPTCPNEGSSPTIVVGNYEITSKGLFGFNLAPYIPSGSTVTHATLQLPGGSSPFSSTPITVTAYTLLSDFNEMTVVWDTAPAFGPSVGTTQFQYPGPLSAPIDVTTQVQTQFAGSKIIGFGVEAQPPYNVFFDSREAPSGTPASLTVEYTVPAGGSTCGSGKCASNALCCNNQACYNPNVHTCTSSGVLCPKNYDSCGSACYNIQLYTCFGGFLCPASTQRCGNACYKSSLFICCGSTLKPVGSSC
jgi:hypothetical protein